MCGGSFAHWVQYLLRNELDRHPSSSSSSGDKPVRRLELLLLFLSMPSALVLKPFVAIVGYCPSEMNCLSDRPKQLGLSLANKVSRFFPF
jgi:hypothetical protein